MRILLLNQAFHPDVAATAQHAHDLARHLVAHGHEVSVIASRSIYGQTGATLPARETVDGAEVHRVGAGVFGKGGLLARAADFGLFYALATTRLLSLGVFGGRRPDVVVAFTTPPLIAFAGLLNRALWGTPYVYWVMDLYPEVAVAAGVMRPGGVAERVSEAFSRSCLRRAARVVALGRCMRERILAKGVDPARVELIPVWADGDEVRPIDPSANRLRRAWGLEGRFVVMYSGNLGVGHAVEPILGAMERLRARQDVRFVFVGGGKRLAGVKGFVAEKGLTNAMFFPYQDRASLGEALGVGDAHLVSQAPAMTGMIVPSKLFGVLAAGRPALYLGDPEAEAGRIVREAGAGEAIDASRPDAEDRLVAAIERWASSPGEAAAAGARGRAALVERYDRAIACESWRRLLEAVDREARA